MILLTSIAPFLAILALHTLRNLAFVSFRHGQNAFSQYNYVYMSSVDILSSYPAQAEAFLREIQDHDLSNIPEHPHERCNDLFFLNAAEHFALCLPKSIADELFIPRASQYLQVGNDRRLLESFEAAHSVVLAVFSCPQNHELVIKCLPFYITTLFGVSQLFFVAIDCLLILINIYVGLPTRTVFATIPTRYQDHRSNHSTSFVHI